VLRLSRFVLAHKLLVVLFWFVVLVAGAVALTGLGPRLSQQITLPGAAGYEANQHILRLYGNGGDGYPEVVAVRLPPGGLIAGASATRALGRAFASVTALGDVRVADYANTANRAFLTTNPHLSYGLVFVPYAGEATKSMAPQITAAMTPLLPRGSQVRVTGMVELKSGGQAKEGLGVVAETLLAGAGALAVLVFVFGSALALAPVLMAAVAIPAAFLAVYGLTEITSVFFIVQYLVALIGLGVAIDYSLLLITRWREELAAGYHKSGGGHACNGDRRAEHRLQRPHRRPGAADARRTAGAAGAEHRPGRHADPRRQRRRDAHAPASPPRGRRQTTRLATRGCGPRERAADGPRGPALSFAGAGPPRWRRSRSSPPSAQQPHSSRSASRPPRPSPPPASQRVRSERSSGQGSPLACLIRSRCWRPPPPDPTGSHTESRPCPESGPPSPPPAKPGDETEPC
jgi:hypothetical protein